MTPLTYQSEVSKENKTFSCIKTLKEKGSFIELTQNYTLAGNIPSCYSVSAKNIWIQFIFIYFMFLILINLHIPGAGNNWYFLPPALFLIICTWHNTTVIYIMIIRLKLNNNFHSELKSIWKSSHLLYSSTLEFHICGNPGCKITAHQRVRDPHHQLATPSVGLHHICAGQCCTTCSVCLSGCFPAQIPWPQDKHPDPVKEDPEGSSHPVTAVTIAWPCFT